MKKPDSSRSKARVGSRGRVERSPGWRPRLGSLDDWILFGLPAALTLPQ